MPLIIDIKVVPGSGRQKWALDKSGMLKCFLKSPPEDGKANRELIAFIATSLKVLQSDVSIIRGLTSRRKTVSIQVCFSFNEMLDLLSLERQMGIAS